MRRLGQELGVEAMSLYHHVPSKDALLDGIVDVVIGEIAVPTETAAWRSAVHGRAMTARTHVRRHPWVTGLITSRRGLRPAMLRYMDWVVGVLTDGGFSRELIHSAIHLLGARLFGFNEETFSEGIQPEDAQPLRALLGTGEYQAIAQAMKGMHHDDDHEFAFGLDLILDGLERARDAPADRAPILDS
jgi:AcrR family transcriptional regulator